MRLQQISVIILLALAASSCGAPATTPAPLTLEDLQSTSMAGAFTALAETHAALPTNTRVPPSGTPTQSPIPSNTSGVLISSHTVEASPIPSYTSEASPTSTTSFTPTFTALPKNQPTVLGNDPCNKPLTAWQGPSTKIMIRYEYKPQGKNDKVVLSLWVMSDLKECGFIPSLSTGPVGQYSAVAFIDGEKDFKVYGGFRLTQGSWDIIIRNDMIIAKGGCYPNC